MPVYTNDIGRRNERIADADREMSKVFDDVTDDVARSFHLDSFARLTASISERIDRAANCVIVLPIALYCFFRSAFRLSCVIGSGCKYIILCYLVCAHNSLFGCRHLASSSVFC